MKAASRPMGRRTVKSSGDTPYYVSAYDDDGEAEEVGTQEDAKSWHGVPRGVMLRWTRGMIC